jgi:hypothetical protein
MKSSTLCFSEERISRSSKQRQAQLARVDGQTLLAGPWIPTKPCMSCANSGATQDKGPSSPFKNGHKSLQEQEAEMDVSKQDGTAGTAQMGAA